MCKEKVPSFDVNCDIKHISMLQMMSSLLNAVYVSQFGCCNPKILQFFQEKSRWQLCNFSSSIQFIKINKAYQRRGKLCITLSEKCTIGILTSLRKIAISPFCNIQIGWKKRHSKVKSSFVKKCGFHVAITFYSLQTRALCSCTIFSRTSTGMLRHDIFIFFT